ncbi:protein CYCLOPS isoform X2 [Eucalyptus grandis]|uniref:protein CYCLOPS isoform X2 n=1 Tax=Eucalyptus grandis TaxID=71139 RepID=UPI00192E8EB2|nr:protein CYCLOPS isoform X2 [Eucalyptus grandis]
MEGRGFLGFYRNSSEEMFLKALMESSVGMPIPTMEMLGFKNLSQNFRTDSEELFKSWLTNAENHGYNSPGAAHRTWQASRRISTELANVSNQEQGDILQKKRSNDLLSQTCSIAEEIPEDLSQTPSRNAAERGWPANNLYLAKAWFHSSQPMTRSRSSELRRRYAAMQSTQGSVPIEVTNSGSVHGVEMKQEPNNNSGFGDLSMSEIPEQLGAFVSPSNSSSSSMNAQPVKNLDRVSSVVSMLKGTLERKKLANQIERETFEDCSQGSFQAQDILANTSFQQGHGDHIHELSLMFHEASQGQAEGLALLPNVERSMDLDFEQLINTRNPINVRAVSQEPSQSESSAAAPIVSSGFDAFDGPSNSSQTLSVCESSRKNVGDTISPENGSKAKDFRERIIDNLKDDKKRGNLVRYGSVSSTGSGDKGDPTKKRRVERSRKMAEAKERNSTSAIPSDVQSILKRCENLEKEVRSLKLNLSFMNRKDSEQTKQIEELQKQNEELTEEKERLLEVIERIHPD